MFKGTSFIRIMRVAIKLAKNGKASSSGRTRHIYIKFLFTKDILHRERILI